MRRLDKILRLYNTKLEIKIYCFTFRKVGAIHESMVVQIRVWLLVKQRKNVKKLHACQGGVPEGRGGYYKFALGEFLHKPPRLLASLVLSWYKLTSISGEFNGKAYFC